METISSLGELAWIGMLPGRGLGDDCAVIPRANESCWLVTTDTLNEGVHFLRDKISAYDLGAKSLAVNLSDIAAMGGLPRWAFLTVSWTPDVAVSWLDEFLLGCRSLLEKYQVELRGGDTNGARHDCSISWTVMGEMNLERVKYRSGAQVGDLICVTGNLGESAAGLECLLKNFRSSPQVDTLLAAHWRPRPHMEEGQWLSQEKAVRSMMDVSDGLTLDLKKLCACSRVGALVRAERLFLSDSLLKQSPELSKSALEFAISGGEDYCLLFTVAPEDFASVANGFKLRFGRTLHPIGEIVHESLGVNFVDSKGHRLPELCSFDHFLKQ